MGKLAPGQFLFLIGILSALCLLTTLALVKWKVERRRRARAQGNHFPSV